MSLHANFYTDYINLVQPHDVYMYYSRCKYIIVVLRKGGISTIIPPELDAKSAYDEDDFSPFAITCLQETFYVTDKKKISVFDKTFQRRNVITHKYLTAPVGIDSRSEQLFVLNGKKKDVNTSIVILQIDGTFIRKIAENVFTDPWSLKINSGGSLVVSDTGAYKLLIINKETGNCICTYNIPPKDGQKIQCRGLDIDDGDNIFVSLRREGFRRQYEYIELFSKDFTTHDTICDDGSDPSYVTTWKRWHGFREDIVNVVWGPQIKPFNFVRGIHCNIFLKKNVLFIVDAENECVRMLTLTTTNHVQCGKTLNEIKEDDARYCDRCNVLLTPSPPYRKPYCPNPRKQYVKGTEYFVYNFRSYQKYYRPVEDKETSYICYICFSKSIGNSFESEREEHSLSFNFQVENEITATQLQTIDTQTSFTLTRFATIDGNEITETQIDQTDTQTSCDDTRNPIPVKTIDGRQHIPLNTAPLENASRPEDLNRCGNISCNLEVTNVKQENGIPSTVFEALRESGIEDSLLVKTEIILRKVQLILDDVFQTKKSLYELVNKAIRGERSTDAKIVKALVRVFYQITSIKKYRPREVQMITCILILVEKKCSSQLFEILTGEGKSCVIAMVAASLALLNKHVTIDIITSSAILAERDLTDWASFYEHFGISVSTNIKIVSKTKMKECYCNKIVIGTVETFAADFLRHEFQRKGIRENRNFHIALVDEVDSMLLDRGIQCTYLSEDLQSLGHFEPILAMIWTSVMSIKSSAEKSFFCGKCVPFYQFIMNHSHSIPKINNTKHLARGLDVLEFAERQNILPCGFRKNVTSAMEESPLTYPQCISNISNDTVVQFYRLCERYVTVCCSYDFYELSDNEICTKIKKLDMKESSNGVNILLLGNGMVCDLVEIEGEPSVSIKKSILSEITSENESTEDKIQVPIHLRDLVNSQILVWISNAFEARKMQLEREYLIKENAVFPIDYGCTGMIEMNKKWGDGLQQFLEMKHFLPLTLMGLITNFISNVAFFQKYKLIYGATGTIGSDAERNFLRKTYKVKIASIPSHMRSNILEHRGRIITAKSEWISEICSILNREIQKKAALVICEDIKTSTELKGMIEASCLAKNVKLYTRNETEEERVVANTLDQGEIVISTNLAGRGADIKVSNSVNENGGLFVLITFLPLNERVEEQAKGRTARGGKPGSAQIIVLRSTLTGGMQRSRSIKEARIIREKQAEEKMTKLQRALNNVLVKDKLFEKYCQLFEKIEKKYVTKTAVMVKNITQIMHERWGIWLKVTDTRGIPLAELKTQLKAEVDKCLKDYFSCGNIYSMVNIGNILMITKKYKEAILHYNTVIKAAKEWSAVAHYGKAICLLQDSGEKSLEDSLVHLTEAYKMLYNNINEQNSTLCYIRNTLQYTKIHATPNRLFLQIQMRLQLLTFCQETILVLIKDLKTFPNRSFADTRTLQSKAVALLCEEFQNQHHDKECDLQVYLKEFSNLHRMGVWQVHALEKIPLYRSNQLFACVVGVTIIAIGCTTTAATFGISKVFITKGITTIVGCSEAFDPLQNVSRTEWLFRESFNLARSCVPLWKIVSSLCPFSTKQSTDSTNSNGESQPEDLLEFILDEVFKAVYSKLSKDKLNAFVINGGTTEFQIKLEQFVQSKIQSYFESPEMIVLTMEMFLLQNEHGIPISDTWKVIEQIYSDIIIEVIKKHLNDKEWQTNFKSFVEGFSAPSSMPEWMTAIKNSSFVKDLLQTFTEWFHNIVVERFNLIRVLWTLNNEFMKHVKQEVCEKYLRDKQRDIAAEAKRFFEENVTFRVKDIYKEVVCKLPRVQRNPLEKNLILTEIEKTVNKIHELLERLYIVVLIVMFSFNRKNWSRNTDVSKELERCSLDIKNITMIAERKDIVSIVIHRLSPNVLDTENLTVDGIYSAEQCKNEIVQNDLCTLEANIADNVALDLRKHLKSLIEKFNGDSVPHMYVQKNLQSLSIFCAETITNTIFKRLDVHLRAQTDSHKDIIDQHKARKHLHYIEEFKEDVSNEIKNIVESPEFAMAKVRVLLSGSDLEITKSAFQEATKECVEANWEDCKCNINTRKGHSPDTIVDHLSICLYDLTAKIFKIFSITPADYTYQQLWAETQYFLSLKCTPGVTKTLCDIVFPLLVAPIEQRCSQYSMKAVNLLLNVANL